MADFTIYCDDLQEGIWFQELDPHFENAELEVIPSKKAEIMSVNGRIRVPFYSLQVMP